MNGKKYIILAAVISACIGFSGCQSGTVSSTDSKILSSISISSGDKENIGASDTFIELGNTTLVTGKGVSISGKTVTINSGGNYSIKGNLEDGQIIVNAESDQKVYVILNGISISNSKSKPIYVLDSKKTIISTAEGTTNNIKFTAAKAAENAEPDAAVFSKSDIVFTGAGSLDIAAEAHSI